MGIMGGRLFPHDTHSQINIDFVICALPINMNIDVLLLLGRSDLKYVSGLSKILS